jgi:isoleucyl-tRNA synthetase
MFVMVDGLTRLLAPILSFTADELWRYLPGRDAESVHVAAFPTTGELQAFHNPALVGRWGRLTALRERVVAQIEPLRKEKQIGSSLQAKVVLSAGDGDLAFLETYAEQLPMLFIVSEVELRASNGSTEPRSDTQVEIGRATGVKCDRCWRYVPAISQDPEWAGLCERCQHAMAGSR